MQARGLARRVLYSLHSGGLESLLEAMQAWRVHGFYKMAVTSVRTCRGFARSSGSMPSSSRACAVSTAHKENCHVKD